MTGPFKSMTPERLAEIREMQGANVTVGDAWGHMWQALRAMDDLLAHVKYLTEGDKRLREGIEALLNDPSHHETYEGGAHACIDADDLNALLNPPTEGESDEPA